VKASKGSGRLVDRDPVAAGRNSGNEGGRTVDLDSVALPAPARSWNRDLDGPVMSLSIPQTAAPLRWLTTAPSPKANTAAMQRPSKVSLVWPTA
jgi:hypothetical protein